MALQSNEEFWAQFLESRIQNAQQTFAQQQPQTAQNMLKSMQQQGIVDHRVLQGIITSAYQQISTQQQADWQQMIGASISVGELNYLGGTRTQAHTETNGNAFLDQQVQVYRKQIEEGMIKMFSNSWTGEKFTGEVLAKPKLPSGVPTPDPVLAGKEDLIEEYKALSQELGMRQPHLEIEIFRKFLEKNNISVFALPAVIAYMDKKAAMESKANSGWCWRPLRAQDRGTMTFGNQGRQALNENKTQYITVGVSDYYGPSPGHGSWPEVYDQTVPLHALRKVAAISKEFGEKVKLFVSDYAPLETIVYPDPFLMAVVPNPALSRGVGRFVIDFWDEPGFGLEQQLGLK